MVSTDHEQKLVRNLYAKNIQIFLKMSATILSLSHVVQKFFNYSIILYQKFSYFLTYDAAKIGQEKEYVRVVVTYTYYSHRPRSYNSTLFSHILTHLSLKSPIIFQITPINIDISANTNNHWNLCRGQVTIVEKLLQVQNFQATGRGRSTYKVIDSTVQTTL